MLSSRSAAITLLPFLLLPGIAAAKETPQPVIARVELRLSMVSHYMHIPERVNFYNANGIPKGSYNYAVPYLVYEPLVTLYNPYNTRLELPYVRVRLENPPVGFKFKKEGKYLREEWNNGEPGHGIARLNISSESLPDARKTFTMILGGGGPSGQFNTRPVRLEPGEARLFFTRVEQAWTWGYETAGTYTPRSFADWYNEKNFTNTDGRTNNPFGAEFVSAEAPFFFYDPRAGFQNDHLSSRTGRPEDTKYSFETTGDTGWVAIEVSDTVGVSAEVLRTFTGSPAEPDFRLLHLAGQVTDLERDLVASYDFDADSTGRPGSTGVISRTFLAGDILQSANDLTPGGKVPFANFVITARSKALRSGAFFRVDASPDTLYETRLEQITDFNQSFAGKPSDPPPEGAIEVLDVEREGDLLIVDFAAVPGRGAVWTLRGGTDLAGGLHDDLNVIGNTVREGPSGSGVYKALINVTDKGPRYFVQIGERPPE